MLILPSPPKPWLTLGALHNSIAEDSCWGEESVHVLGQQSKSSEVTVMFTSLTHEAPDPPVSIGFHTSELGQEQEGLSATACPMPSTALFHLLFGVQCQKLERRIGWPHARASWALCLFGTVFQHQVWTM